MHSNEISTFLKLTRFQKSGSLDFTIPEIWKPGFQNSGRLDSRFPAIWKPRFQNSGSQDSRIPEIRKPRFQNEMHTNTIFLIGVFEDYISYSITLQDVMSLSGFSAGVISLGVTEHFLHTPNEL